MKSINWNMGVSSCSMESIDRVVFEEYAKNEISMMEISLSWDKYKSINWEQTERNARETGIQLWSFHLPFAPFSENNIASPDKAVREKTIEMQKEYIQKMGNIGIGIAVIHPSGEPIGAEMREEMLKYSADSLAQLAEEGEKCGVTIAVEDLPRTCLGRNSAEIKRLISADDRLRVCFDTNHLLSQPIKEFIEDIGDKIITTHFSDYDFKNERHWLPGEGQIDWKELIETLEKVGYSGPILYELGLVTPAVGTINRRTLTFADLKENYDCLRNKLPLKAIGTPVLQKCLPWE